jgi:histidine phosphotransfer protein HptB
VNDETLNREIFDRLKSSTATQPAVLAELCRDYLTEARATVAQLREALSQQNAPQVRDRAHYLKGSSMMLGARDVSEACATLETMGRNSNLTGAGPALDDLLTALKRVEAELAEIVGPTVLPAEGSAA